MNALRRLAGPAASLPPLELWGGLECTVNRVGDTYFSQLERNGHATRLDDLERFASLGIKALRYPVLWERTAPGALEDADWSWADARVPALRELGIRPILGLLHHGSGPAHTHLLDPGFAPGLARFAGAVARRYPWVQDYTPVNEPLTTARFSALYGVWYPHRKDDASFVRALVNQCRAVVLSMQAIREANPRARLVQTDDLGHTRGTEQMADVVAFYNERRWLCWDLLCGRVDEAHPLWRWLRDAGVAAAELHWFRDHPCPPDVIGVNHYVTGDRWLDHRTERYPARYHGGPPHRRFADIEAARAVADPPQGLAPLLESAWQRYGRPLAVTEAHIDTTREGQLRWLDEIWQAAQAARAKGADVQAVTVWALLGSYDWNSLVTCCEGYYEPGPFDARSEPPRPTALAGLMRELASRGEGSHPVLAGNGWWRRPGRFFCEPVAARAEAGATEAQRESGPPLLITGAAGTLGRAFERVCEQRHLRAVAATRTRLDIGDEDAIARVLDEVRPWAVVNCSGYVRIDDAEHEPARCLRENSAGAAALARACARRGIALLSFSTDQVFDGRSARPYVESDPVAPLNVYGRSKARAEQALLAAGGSPLVVRTSAFFGPWDAHNFLTVGLRALSEGQEFHAADDIVVTPTYVPDLVRACLDLLIDGATGIWHLAHAEPVTWAEFLRRAAEQVRVPPASLRALPNEALRLRAARPAYAALGSERACGLMPSLEDALERFCAAWRAERAELCLPALVVPSAAVRKTGLDFGRADPQMLVATSAITPVRNDA